MRCVAVLALFLLFGVNSNGQSYPYQPDITRVEGTGNGRNILELTAATVQEILANNVAVYPVYRGGEAPILVEVVDTVNFLPGDYQLFFSDATQLGFWTLTHVPTQISVFADSLNVANHTQYISMFGIEVTVNQFVNGFDTTNGINIDTLLSSVTYADPNQPWLGGVSDNDMIYEEDWIRAGFDSLDYIGISPDQQYEQIVNGTFAPYRLVSGSETYDPVSSNMAGTIPLMDLYHACSFDLILSADTSLWTRCPVVEMQPDPNLAIDGVEKMQIREAPSVDKMGLPDGSGFGMGWFPGYVINVENGERLNLAFAEDSHLSGDMLWNPTDVLYDSVGNPVFGGSHNVYVFDNQDHRVPGADRMPRYDNGAYSEAKLHGSNGNIIKVWRSCLWVWRPMVTPGSNLLATDAHVRVRMAKMFEQYLEAAVPENNTDPMYSFSLDSSAVLSVSETALPNEVALEIQAWPNPFTSHFQVSLDKKISDARLTVYDEAGREQFQALMSSQSIAVAAGDWSSGVYKLVISDAAGRVHGVSSVVHTR